MVCIATQKLTRKGCPASGRTERMPAKPAHIDMDPALRQACLPGVDNSNANTITYRLVSAAAEREYGPDEGWTRVVRYKKKAHRQRRDQSS